MVTNKLEISKGALTVLVRLNCADWELLDRCLFFLSAQRHTPTEIIVIPMGRALNGDGNHLNQVCSRWRKRFSNLILLDSNTRLGYVPALQKLLQLSISNYLAIVDVQHKIYPHLYEELILELEASKDRLWAFCDVVMTHFSEYMQLEARWTPFLRTGYSFVDHLKIDFIPIHSVVINLRRVNLISLFRFNFSSDSDHKFLLMLASMHEPIYLPVIGAEQCSPYLLRNGVIPVEEELSARYLVAKTGLDLGIWWKNDLPSLPWVKQFLDPIWNEALYSFEQKNYPDAFYFRKKLKQMFDSRSWRVTRILRNCVSIFKNEASAQDEIPRTEWLALKQIEAIQQSTSWNITGFMRIFEKGKYDL